MQANSFELIPWSKSQAAAEAADKIGLNKTYAVCRVISTSLEGIIPPIVLVGILRGNIPIYNWMPHMQVFFDECPANYVQSVIEENRLSKRDLGRCYIDYTSAKADLPYLAAV